MSAALLSLELPHNLEASEPPEARGLTRDAVRMMVAYRTTGRTIDSSFGSLPMFLEPGDLVVINTSGTIAAAVAAVAEDGAHFVIHFSTRLTGSNWVVEPRFHSGGTSVRWSGGPPSKRVSLGYGASLELLERYRESERLWIAHVEFPTAPLSWLATHGRPIRYGYVPRSWPLSSYQNIYATEPGSAEMPSAGRPFTAEIVTRLVAKGVGVTPIVLHTGVSSLEADETPFPEPVIVPRWTASRVNDTRREGGRVIAVGTTVVRALESAADKDGVVHPTDSWTDLVITPERGVCVVDGLLTGWHEPEASHLLILEAIAGRTLLEASYSASVESGYLWHEFGDTHLVLP